MGNGYKTRTGSPASHRIVRATPARRYAAHKSVFAVVTSWGCSIFASMRNNLDRSGAACVRWYWSNSPRCRQLPGGAADRNELAPSSDQRSLSLVAAAHARIDRPTPWRAHTAGARRRPREWIGEALYAAPRTDDSPLFVATWYTIAIGGGRTDRAKVSALVALRPLRGDAEQLRLLGFHRSFKDALVGVRYISMQKIIVSIQSVK
jgi:hypothetical protein